MANGEGGRTAEMVDGAERVREPRFSVQTESKYRRTTVLDNLMPTGNGISALDQQRRLMGGRGSGSGSSKDTFEKRLWLDQQPSPSLYKTFG